jgi:dienelactone hydrolase
VNPLDGYACEPFTAGGVTRDVYRLGSGPAVIVVHEVPGITPNVAAFGRRVADIGCTAVLPSLFGTPGKAPTAPYGLRSMVQCCISREFATFAMNKTSPITVYLRALATAEHGGCGGPGVGVVGMCMTGGFALAMMVDEVVLAPVLSQPSLPLPMGAARRAATGVSNADLMRAKERTDDGVCVLGLRFTGDRFVPAERFETLRRTLGDGFVAVEIDSSKGNEHDIVPAAHSVLTEHFVDTPGHPTRDALDRVLELFRSRLLSAQK